jgi:hypothetical protein
MKTTIGNCIYWLATPLIVAISYVSWAANSIPCNSFPKILGGPSGHSILHQLDVFDDYLAFGGGTNDPALTTKSWNVPYIILSSISINYNYWTKAFFQI